MTATLLFPGMQVEAPGLQLAPSPWPVRSSEVAGWVPLEHCAAAAVVVGEVAVL